MTNFSRQQVSTTRWQQAQKGEAEIWREFGGADDWNDWWQTRFDNYSMLRNRSMTTLNRVG